MMVAVGGFRAMVRGPRRSNKTASDPSSKKPTSSSTRRPSKKAAHKNKSSGADELKDKFVEEAPSQGKFSAVSGLSALNVIHEFQGLLSDPTAQPNTPLSKYIGGGGPASVISVIGPRIIRWQPLAARGLSLDQGELGASTLVGHLTYAIAVKAYRMGEPLVAGSW